MKKKTEFPFARSRRITWEEVESAKVAIKEQFGIETAERSLPYPSVEKDYKTVSIQLHPKILQWAKETAKKRGVSYQVVINEALLELLKIQSV